MFQVEGPDQQGGLVTRINLMCAPIAKKELAYTVVNEVSESEPEIDLVANTYMNSSVCARSVNKVFRFVGRDNTANL